MAQPKEDEQQAGQEVEWPVAVSQRDQEDGQADEPCRARDEESVIH